MTLFIGINGSVEFFQNLAFPVMQFGPPDRMVHFYPQDTIFDLQGPRVIGDLSADGFFPSVHGQGLF